MSDNNTAVKLWRYALLYAGIQIAASIVLVILAHVFSFMHSTHHSMLSMVMFFVAGQITVYQFYKKNNRIMTWPEINRVAMICGTFYTVIILLFVGMLSLSTQKNTGIGGFIIIVILVCAIQWGLLYLSFFAGRRLVGKQIKRLEKSGA